MGFREFASSSFQSEYYAYNSFLYAQASPIVRSSRRVAYESGQKTASGVSMECDKVRARLTGRNKAVLDLMQVPHSTSA
jgi:hypothetical protein